MAMTDTPWFIGMQGVQHSAEVARSLAYAATGGQTGVARPGDLKVVALDTPGPTVRVTTGACAILSTYPGANAQSYIGRQDYMQQLPNFTMPTSGPRSDLIIARIYDPQYGTYAGWDPTKPNSFDFFRVEVIQGVPSNTRDYTTTYPSLVLARIDIPNGAQSILPGYIVDLRQKVNPLYHEEAYILRGNVVKSMPRGTYDWWPLFNGVNQTIHIPSWCTRIVSQWDFSGIVISGASDSNMVAGGVRANLGNVVENTDHTIIAQTSNGRITHTHVAAFNVPESLRGKDAVLGTKGNLSTGSGNIAIDAQSTATLSVRFFEAVV